MASEGRASGGPSSGATDPVSTRLVSTDPVFTRLVSMAVRRGWGAAPKPPSRRPWRSISLSIHRRRPRGSDDELRRREPYSIQRCNGCVPVDPRPRQRGLASTDASYWPRSTAPRGRPAGFRLVVGPQISSVANLGGGRGPTMARDGGGGWHAPPSGLLRHCSGGGPSARRAPALILFAPASFGADFVGSGEPILVLQRAAFKLLTRRF
ncbi:unnamed protein product [Triticum aestivum]|uniref:Uncharacterized protein n=1 Tax=Triticum aestivum TaxID=4565 RepID=A0A7H4LFG4_WHEAT|nr:unnamed protein product [Triticum aestivum]